MQALRKVNHNIQSWFGRGNRLSCVWNVTSCLVSQMRSQFELWSSRTGRVESRCIIFLIYLFFFLRHSQANIREMASVFICQWLRAFWAWKISLVMQATLTLKRSLHCCEKSTCVTFQCLCNVDALHTTKTSISTSISTLTQNYQRRFVCSFPPVSVYIRCQTVGY